jgi:Mg-chelatase subunit ChlD
MKTKTCFRTTLCSAAIFIATGGFAYAQGIDVVFKIDESGSMGDDIAAVQANVVTIFNALPAGSHVGLVGYGTSQHGGGAGQIPHIHTPLTTDVTTFQNAVNQLVANGGLE